MTNATTAITAKHIEILALAALACLLASTIMPLAVWAGVAVAYAAFLKAHDLRLVAIAQRKGYFLLNLNIAPGVSICAVVRSPQPPPLYNVWQLQAKGAKGVAA